MSGESEFMAMLVQLVNNVFGTPIAGGVLLCLLFILIAVALHLPMIVLVGILYFLVFALTPVYLPTGLLVSMLSIAGIYVAVTILRWVRQ